MANQVPSKQAGILDAVSRGTKQTEQEARTDTYTMVYHTHDEQEYKHDVTSLEEMLAVMQMYHSDPLAKLHDILGMGSVLHTEARAPYTIRWQGCERQTARKEQQDPKWDIDCTPEMVTLLQRIGHMMNRGFEIANINEKGGRSLVTDSFCIDAGEGIHTY